MDTPTSGLTKHTTVVPNYGSASSSSSSINVSSSRSHGRLATFSRHLAAEVDITKVTPAMTAYSFMTGYMDAISFSGLFVWVGFQTGNFTQLSLAFARGLQSLMKGKPIPPDFGVAELNPAEQHALCSILAFFVALFVFGRIGDRIGTHRRSWLFGGTLLQAVLTMIGAYTFHSIDLEVPAFGMVPTLPTTVRYFLGIACLSASLGVQGFMARRLATQFSTTIVLTAIFVELTTDPTLFNITRSVPSRDHKWLAVIFLFMGAVTGQLMLGQLGLTSTLLFAAGFRVLISISFLFTPGRLIQLP
ncbi:hypothetical protein BKA70DRAFT_1119373 [Coprinopsis sp. MPI-PUGE-AT-0042]|nr:hypothetical protein BKA70DRAFT_1119373 [Coprinopsis sp. MPI-PUGE-AT-0042]